MIRCLTRDLTAIAAGVAAWLTAAAVPPFRVGWPDANVALLPAVVVVAVAATGNRVAGGLAAAGAAVWLDFFFTLPYERFTIRGSPDVAAFVLLLVVGVPVSQLAARARRLKVIAITDAQIRETASLPRPRPFVVLWPSMSASSPPACWTCRNAVLTTVRCPVTRRGWSPAGRCWQVMAAGTRSARACPARRWSCVSSAAASITGASC